jgi:hypothetical protein
MARLTTQAAHDRSGTHPALSGAEQLAFWFALLNGPSLKSSLPPLEQIILDSILKAYHHQSNFHLDGPSSSQPFTLTTPTVVLAIFESFAAQGKFVCEPSSSPNGHANVAQSVVPESKREKSRNRKNGGNAAASSGVVPPSSPAAPLPNKGSSKSQLPATPTLPESQHYESSQDKVTRTLSRYRDNVSSLVTIFEDCGIQLDSFLEDVNFNGGRTKRWIQGSPKLKLDVEPLVHHKQDIVRIIYAMNPKSQHYVGPELATASKPKVKKTARVNIAMQPTPQQQRPSPDELESERRHLERENENLELKKKNHKLEVKLLQHQQLQKHQLQKHQLLSQPPGSSLTIFKEKPSKKERQAASDDGSSCGGGGGGRGGDEDDSDDEAVQWR